MSIINIFLFVLLFLAAVAFGVAGIFCWIFLKYFSIWVESTAAGLKISPFYLVMMHMRKNPVIAIVDAYKVLKKAGIVVTLEELEAHVMSGGHLEQVSGAVVSADKAGIQLSFKQIAAIDLAGRNVLDAVESHVNPKVLLCPSDGSGYKNNELSSVAKDGIKLGVRARITVRTKLEKIVGGAGENTVIARVGEGIVATIGKAESHREILERPEIITSHILAAGLDSGTCFEILSVDISSVDIIENIAAVLQSERAVADKRIAQAYSEKRRAIAVASRQEMIAKTSEMQSRLIEARKILPLAVGDAVHKEFWGSLAPLNDWMKIRKIGSKV
ncbi:MAG: flotillin-like FloA family protein [Lentisphaeria bacterium]